MARRMRGFDGEDREASEYDMLPQAPQATNRRAWIPSWLSARARHITQVYGHHKLLLATTIGAVAVLKGIDLFLKPPFPWVPVVGFLRSSLNYVIGDWRGVCAVVLLILLLSFWESSYRRHNPQKEVLTPEESEFYNTAYSPFQMLSLGAKLALRKVNVNVTSSRETLVAYLRNIGFADPEADFEQLRKTDFLRSSGSEVRLDPATAKIIKKLLREEALLPPI